MNLSRSKRRQRSNTDKRAAQDGYPIFGDNCSCQGRENKISNKKTRFLIDLKTLRKVILRKRHREHAVRR